MTPAQLVTLKAALLADANLSADIAAGNHGNIVSYMNADSPSGFMVWRTVVKTEDIFDAIVWSSLTPVDVPDATQEWANRSLACQGKQFNLQTILSGRQTINGTKANIRAGLQDALLNVPAGVSGALLNAGWAAVKAVLSRVATRAEALYATGTGTVASPGLLTFEGKVQTYDVIQALTQV